MSLGSLNGSNLLGDELADCGGDGKLILNPCFGGPIGLTVVDDVEGLRSIGCASMCRSAKLKFSDVVDIGEEIGVSNPVLLFKGVGESVRSCCDQPDAKIGRSGVGGLRLELFALERCLDKKPLFSDKMDVFEFAVGIQVVSKLVDVGSGEVDVIRGGGFTVAAAGAGALGAVAVAGGLDVPPAEPMEDPEPLRIGRGAECGIGGIFECTLTGVIGILFLSASGERLDAAVPVSIFSPPDINITVSPLPKASKASTQRAFLNATLTGGCCGRAVCT